MDVTSTPFMQRNRYTISPRVAHPIVAATCHTKIFCTIFKIQLTAVGSNCTVLETNESNDFQKYPNDNLTFLT
jgi:hypothetical protein